MYIFTYIHMYLNRAGGVVYSNTHKPYHKINKTNRC